MLSLGWGTKTSNRPQWWWWAWAWDNDSSLLRDRVEGLESYYWGQEYNPQDTWGLLSNQGFPNYGEWVSTTQWWQASYSFPNHCFWVISVDRQPLWLEEDSKEWEKGTLVSLKSILKNKERFLWGRPLFILLGLCFLFGKTCQENLLPSFFKSLGIKGQTGDKNRSKFRGLSTSTACYATSGPGVDLIWICLSEGSPFVFRASTVPCGTSCDMSRPWKQWHQCLKFHGLDRALLFQQHFWGHWVPEGLVFCLLYLHPNTSFPILEYSKEEHNLMPILALDLPSFHTQKRIFILHPTA